MFVPERVFFEREALDHDLGRRLMGVFRDHSTEILVIEGRTPPSIPIEPGARSEYSFAKRSLVVAVRRSLRFQTCKPSAHYQLPLVTGCPGMCEYCYLQTTLGPRPFVTVYVNVPEILSRAREHVRERAPAVTTFEAGAVGDPVPVEPYTGALAETIGFFAGEEHGQLRVATKFDDVDTLLELDHGNRAHFRFSVNAPTIVAEFERGAPALSRRLSAARRMAEKGYPVGFIVAPVFSFPGWIEEYGELARLIRREMEGVPGVRPTLEFISHRFTARAKACILARNARSRLPLDERERVLKRGQFGYFKYVYPSGTLREMKDKLVSAFAEQLPGAKIEYFV